MFIVLMIYIVLLVFSPEKAVESGKNSIYYIIEMIKIMPVVIVLTALIDTWIPKKAIMTGLGENSKIKGALLAFALGSLSAGPIYVAFPVCKMLYKKGASVSNIVIILSTWAVVKVPMLANEAKFLGMEFMTTRWILTSISIFIMGYLISRIVKRKDISSDEQDIKKTDSKIITVKEEYCVDCGICVKMMPMHFVMDNKMAKVVIHDINMKKAKEKIKMVIEKCPGNAIFYQVENKEK